MTNELQLRALEKIVLFKCDLYEFGPIVDDDKVGELWALFKHVLGSLNIDYVTYWYATGEKASEISVYEYGVENEGDISDEEKAELLSDWEDVPYSFVEKTTEGYDRNICCWLPFFSNTPGFKAAASLIICDINEDEEDLWELILIELSMIIELINARIVVKNSTFADKVDKLTLRQYDILKEVGKSQGREKAAKTLGIALQTFDNHLRSVKAKIATDPENLPSLERIGTSYSKYGTARKEYRSLMKKVVEGDE